MMGFTQIGDHLFKCDKCGKEISSGIANIATHWNECIDEGRSLKALTEYFTQPEENRNIDDIRHLWADTEDAGFGIVEQKQLPNQTK